MQAKIRHQRKREQIPLNSASELVFIDILESVPLNTPGKQFMVIIKNRSSKLTRVLSPTKISSTQVAKSIVNYSVISYGILGSILSDNAQGFVGKFYSYMYTYLGVTMIIATPYYPQTIRLVERYNQKLGLQLRHYVTDHQSNRKLYVEQLTNAYIFKSHRLPNIIPFCWHPQDILLV